MVVRKNHGLIASPLLETDTKKAAASGIPAMAGAAFVTPMASTAMAVNTKTETTRNETPTVVGAGAANSRSTAPASASKSPANVALLGVGTPNHRVDPRYIHPSVSMPISSWMIATSGVSTFRLRSVAPATLIAATATMPFVTQDCSMSNVVSGQPTDREASAATKASGHNPRCRFTGHPSGPGGSAGATTRC